MSGTTVADLAERVTDSIVDGALRDGGRVGWAAWHRRDVAGPPTLGIGGPEVYDGDAGIAWALTALGTVVDRPRTEALARAALAPRPLPGPGLLDGRAGVHVVSTALAGSACAGPGAPPLPTADEVGPGSDLLDGVAGVLLAAISAGAASGAVAALGAVLLDLGAPRPGGWCYPGPPDGTGAPARPLVGLAHGSSGVLLALGHWLATDPPAARAEQVRDRLRAVWRWESAWADPVRGWPDLREQVPGHPVMWCHGAAGVAAARLELVALADAGVDLGVPGEVVRAQAESAVLLCRGYAQACGEQARHQVASAGTVPVRADPPDAGLTLCHGLGGALDVLATAGRRWGVVEHLELARSVALDVAAALGEDPALWPTGQRTRGGYGLFQGLSGTALVLARLAHPLSDLPSPGLFGVPARLP